MPVFYEHINDFAKIAIWHIAEANNFFLNKVPLQREISHPHKQLQHLAGRYLLQYLHPDFPNHLIEIADTRKPFLPNEAYHFSISHCGDYAAVIVSKIKRVGIDVELVSPVVEKIKHKFLNIEELENIQYSIINNQYSSKSPELITDNSKLLTLLWSCKEAVFKWYGNGGVDFKEHIHILPFNFNNINGMVNCIFLKDEKVTLQINYRWFDNLCLAWVV